MRLFIWLIVLLSMLTGQVSASATLSEYNEARKLYMAAGACMASYSNRAGSLAIAAFEQEGVAFLLHYVTGVSFGKLFLW